MIAALLLTASLSYNKTDECNILTCPVVFGLGLGDSAALIAGLSVVFCFIVGFLIVIYLRASGKVAPAPSPG